MVTATLPTTLRAKLKRRRESEDEKLPTHPLIGLLSATRAVASIDQQLADRSLSQPHKRELMTQLRALTRAAAKHASDLLEESYQRYESTHS